MLLDFDSDPDSDEPELHTIYPARESPQFALSPLLLYASLNSAPPLTSKKDIPILFWYSGHGQTLEEADGTQLGYLVPVDAPDPDRDLFGFMNTAVSMRTIETVSKQIRSKHVLMAFDSFFSWPIFQMLRAKPSAYVQEKVAWPVRQFITAGTEDEQVPDRSVFKDVFIQAIRDGFADLNGDTYITGEELGGYLQENVVNYTRKAQHPQFGKINNPKLDKGDFVFLTASSGAVIDTPSSPQGRLSVTANVSNAEVIVDGRLIGNTPLTAMALSTGSHRVQVKKKGYDTYRTSVEISTGRTASLEAWLTEQGPKTARLYVNTDPSNARVRILNIGPVFQQGMELSPGDYHVEVSAEGYGKQTRWVSLSAGEDKRIGFRLAGTEPASRPAPVVSPSTTAASKSRITNSLSMDFVYIQPGTFMMGSPNSESIRDRDERHHKVTLTRGYYLQTTEVTQGQWRQVMGSNPSNFKRCGDDCPVERVSWDDAQTFIQKLNQKESTDKYRLPTEAEWEYAARAGSTGWYGFGDSTRLLGNYAWYESNSGQQTHAVGQKRANAWGLYDIHGNVLEWCQDWYGHYPTGSVTDPKGPSSGVLRVYRGGGWDARSIYCRSADRSRGAPDSRGYDLGLRLAISVLHFCFLPFAKLVRTDQATADASGGTRPDGHGVRSRQGTPGLVRSWDWQLVGGAGRSPAPAIWVPKQSLGTRCNSHSCHGSVGAGNACDHSG